MARPPRKACGAATRRCACGHHKADHADRQGACTACACQAFAARPCANVATRTNGRCRMHGGTADVLQAGPRNHAYKHGRYSSALPADLGERYAEALASGDLLSLRDEVAVLEARIAELLAAAGPARAQWQEARAAYDAMHRANAAGDQAALGQAVAALGRALQAGAQGGQAWAEAASLMERKRRLARDEVRRLATLGQVITAERAMVLVSALADAVMRHVADDDARKRIGDDFRRLVGAVTRPGG